MGPNEGVPKQHEKPLSLSDNLSRSCSKKKGKENERVGVEESTSGGGCGRGRGSSDVKYGNNSI